VSPPVSSKSNRSGRKDPNTSGTEADIAAQTKVMLQIRDNVNLAARAINEAELVRSQLIALRTVIGDGEAQKAVLKAAGDLEVKIAAPESRLFNMTSTGRGQDMLRTPSQMVEKLSHLADVVSYADFAPTDSQNEVNGALTQQLARDQEQIAGILARDVAVFNALLQEHKLGAIVVRQSRSARRRWAGPVVTSNERTRLKCNHGDTETVSCTRRTSAG
jgi:hypothetical protein